MTEIDVSTSTVHTAAATYQYLYGETAKAIDGLTTARDGLKGGTEGAASSAAVLELDAHIVAANGLYGRLGRLQAWTASAADAYDHAQSSVDGLW